MQRKNVKDALTAEQIDEFFPEAQFFGLSLCLHGLLHLFNRCCLYDELYGRDICIFVRNKRLYLRITTGDGTDHVIDRILDLCV